MAGRSTIRSLPSSQGFRASNPGVPAADCSSSLMLGVGVKLEFSCPLEVEHAAPPKTTASKTQAICIPDRRSGQCVRVTMQWPPFNAPVYSARHAGGLVVIPDRPALRGNLWQRRHSHPVSYTHLTLPTIYSV